MKSLGAILAVALVVVPFGATAASNGGFSPAYRAFLENSEKAIGHNVDWDNTLLSTVAFNMPANAVGVKATYDVVSGVLNAGPIYALADQGAQDGCVVANPLVPPGFALFGYGQAGLGTGDSGSGCPFVINPGTVDTMQLLCVNQFFCEQAVIGQGGFFGGEIIISCSSATLTYSAQTADPLSNNPPVGTGTCSVFGFFFDPVAAWVSHYDLGEGSNGNGAVVDLINY